MMVPRIVRSILSLALVLAGVLGLSAQPATANHTSCTNRMHSPHVSAGAGGVIAKGTFDCGGKVDIQAGMYLFVCDQAPTNSDETTWPERFGCVEKASNISINISFPSGGGFATRVVPNLGNPGKHGTGYWIACLQYLVTADGNSLQGSDISPAMYINA